MLEVDAFLFPASAQQKETDNGQCDTNPLEQVELLAEEKHGAQQHHDGACGVDGTHQCERKMLHAEIAAEPTAQYDATFQHDELLYVPPSEIGMEQVAGRNFSRSGKKEGIDFKHNRWVAMIVAAAILGAISGLYDKYLMAPPENGGVGLQPMTVQSYYNFYQLLMMSVMVLCLWYPTRHRTTPFRWKGSIVWISVFLSMADFAYFYALSMDGAMVSIVSMVRRGSVVVSFLLGAYLFHEKNLKSKAIDLLLVLLGLIFLYLGSK